MASRRSRGGPEARLGASSGTRNKMSGGVEENATSPTVPGVQEGGTTRGGGGRGGGGGGEDRELEFELETLFYRDCGLRCSHLKTSLR